jgi:hypothetical protein
MQREKEIKRQKSGRVKPGCINKEKKDGLSGYSNSYDPNPMGIRKTQIQL